LSFQAHDRSHFPQAVASGPFSGASVFPKQLHVVDGSRQFTQLTGGAAMALHFEDFDSFYLERLRSGDFSAQQHFVAYFGELIRLKAGKRLRSMAAVEDVRQETLSRVLRLVNEQRIRQPERLGAFVNSVCNNVLQEQYRSASREASADPEVVNSIPDPAIGVVEAISRRQVQEGVRQTLDELPEKDRCVLKAVFLEERDKDEVCRDFGVTRDYLRVLVHRAKLAFKSRYLLATRKPARICSARAGSMRAQKRNQRNEAFPVVQGLSSISRGT
jgi:RNA polymerase sigma-70 factor (ECF subfamily)